VVEELVQVRVGAGIVCDLEERHEDIVEDLAEVLDQLVCFEYITGGLEIKRKTN
jgi:methyl coenzyme M reductase subunit D